MRSVIAAELDSINPIDALESEHLSDAKQWVPSGAELWRLAKPTTPPKHLVSYFVLIDVTHVRPHFWGCTP